MHIYPYMEMSFLQMHFPAYFPQPTAYQGLHLRSTSAMTIHRRMLIDVHVRAFTS